MSKMFSVVTLASDSGLLEEYYAPGSPDCAEDLLEDEIIRDDLRSLPKSDRVYTGDTTDANAYANWYKTVYAPAVDAGSEETE